MSSDEEIVAQSTEMELGGQPRGDTGGEEVVIGATTPILELRGITKRFGGVVACEGVNLQLRSGEVLAVVGNNGAGKSTVLRIISGAYLPDEGEVLLHGKIVRLRSVRAARVHGIEAVPQELALAPKLDVVTNIFLGREITHRPAWLGFLARRRMEVEAKRLIATVGSEIPWMNAKVGTLSGGQRQAVAIARALGWGQSVVVLDEPTAALGVRETAQVEKAIGHMKELNLGILLVSHDLDQVFRVADRVYVLYHGRVVGVEHPASSTRERIVAMITTGEDVRQGTVGGG